MAGFRIKRQTFIRRLPDATQLINVQRSVASNNDTVIITLNFGIYLPDLALLLGDPAEIEDIQKSHWQSRIGSFIPESGGDKWWRISSLPEAEEASIGVVSLLEKTVLPHIESLSNAAALCELWKQGKHPGIFRADCDMYVAKLCST